MSPTRLSLFSSMSILLAGCAARPTATTAPPPTLIVAPTATPITAPTVWIPPTPTPLPAPTSAPVVWDKRSDREIAIGMVENVSYNIQQSQDTYEIADVQKRITQLRSQSADGRPPKIDPACWPAIIGEGRFQKALEMLDESAKNKSDYLWKTGNQNSYALGENGRFAAERFIKERGSETFSQEFPGSRSNLAPNSWPANVVGG